jgi:hypothetical protein
MNHEELAELATANEKTPILQEFNFRKCEKTREEKRLENGRQA